MIVRSSIAPEEPEYFDPDEVKAALDLRALLERYGARIQGDGRTVMVNCVIHQDKSPSMSVDLGKGVFHCFGCNEGGSGIDLIMAVEKLSFPDALKKAASYAGVHGRAAPPVISFPKPPPPVPPPFVPEPMPATVSKLWADAVELARRRPLRLYDVARERGWPEWAVEELADGGQLGLADYHGTKGPAFPVECPDPGDGGSMVQVGFHVRLSKAEGWRFLPNASEHGRGIPGLPFVMGDLAGASAVAVCEGQWDAITAGLALSWFAQGKPWPDGVAAVGIRGKHGVKPFLEHWRPFWPRGCTVLLFPDSDPSGVPWRAPGGLREVLVGISKRVIDVASVGGAKDLNDAVRGFPKV